MEVAGAGKKVDTDKEGARYFIPSSIRRQQERAARDPAYAARLRSSQTEARFNLDSIDTGGDS